MGKSSTSMICKFHGIWGWYRKQIWSRQISRNGWICQVTCWRQTTWILSALERALSGTQGPRSILCDVHSKKGGFRLFRRSLITEQRTWHDFFRISGQLRQNRHSYNQKPSITLVYWLVTTTTEANTLSQFYETAVLEDMFRNGCFLQVQTAH